MKLNTISKGIATCILAGTLLLGVNACDKPKQESKEITPQTKKEYVVEKVGKNCRIIVTPEFKTGQTLEVLAKMWDNENGYDVKEIKLYEDDKLIGKKEGNYDNSTEAIHKFIRHKEPGVRSYYAEFYYHNGGVIRTETKKVEFTGQILDLPPYRPSISIYNNALNLSASDEGDNKGIVEIEIYEDGWLWKKMSFDSEENVRESIPLDLTKEGKHEYWAYFTDRGGNRVPTDTIIVRYK
jgi:hypothetical protein